jgi:hypothetical protein
MRKRFIALVATLLLLLSCWVLRDYFNLPVVTPASFGLAESTTLSHHEFTSQENSDLSKADIRLLLIGNSHTHSQDLPKRIVKMVEFVNPGKKVAARTIAVGFLDDATEDPKTQEVLKSFAWNAVILQAQKISSSGRTTYSTEKGIELAKQAKELGLPVFFFAEWGLKGTADSTERTHKIYAEMAEASGATLIPVGLSWEKVFQQFPEVPLHDFDGNHQSSLGADLTALVLASYVAKQPFQKWSDYVPTTASPEQWRIFLLSSP